MFRMILLELWLPNCAGAVKFLSTHLKVFIFVFPLIVKLFSCADTKTVRNTKYLYKLFIRVKYIKKGAMKPLFVCYEFLKLESNSSFEN